jgi:hypothetical protein
MKLLHDGRLVGVFLAIYSDQYLNGLTEQFCNPHSSSVLPEFGRDARTLAAALVRQPGYHFSMLTPNRSVEAVFRYLRFKELDSRVAIFPMLLSPTRMQVVDQPDEISGLLSGSDLVDYDKHASLAWLRHILVTERGVARCLVTYKLRKWKRMACADMIGISDAAQFDRCLPAIRNYLLLRRRTFWGRLEERFIARPPPLSYRTFRVQPKLFLSRSLGDSDIRDLYTELVALDL